MIVRTRNNEFTQTCKKQYPLFPLLLLLAIVFFVPGSSLAAADVSSHTLKQKELKQLRAEIKTLQKDLKQQQSKKSQLQKDIKLSEQAIADNAGQLFIIQQQTQQLNKKLLTLNNTVLLQTQNLAAQQQILSSQLQTSYAIGRQEFLKLLLNQQNPSTVSRIMTYYDYFHAARQKQIEQVNSLLQSLAQDKEQINLTTQELRDKQYQLKQKKQDLVIQQLQRNELVAELNSDIASKDKQLSELQLNKKNLSTLIKKLKKTMDEMAASVTNLPTKTKFKKQRGKLYWPAKGKVKRLFGRWRSVGKVKWQGIIIKTGAGTTVHSISHGRIAYSDWLRGYGLITIIDHGDGYMSLYGHNQTLLKEVGDWVEKNEIIATVGSSGGLKKSGLYFEIRHNGKPSNPSRWCKKKRH